MEFNDEVNVPMRTPSKMQIMKVPGPEYIYHFVLDNAPPVGSLLDTSLPIHGKEEVPINTPFPPPRKTTGGLCLPAPLKLKRQVNVERSFSPVPEEEIKE